MIENLLLNAEVLLLVLCIGGALLAGAAMLVLRQPMRVAMALIMTMLFLGGIYGLLGVHFIAAFQILIYVGAVMVFMVYVIMLLEVREPAGGRYSGLLLPGAVGFLLLLAVAVVSVWNPLPAPSVPLGKTSYGMAGFSIAFVGPYWLLFELTSVLLVAAVVAALAVIRVGNRSRHG